MQIAPEDMPHADMLLETMVDVVVAVEENTAVMKELLEELRKAK